MNKIIEGFYGILWLLTIAVTETASFIWRTLRLPVRWTVCRKKGHDWLWLGNGFFGMFAPKYPLECTKCGKKAKWDDVD